MYFWLRNLSQVGNFYLKDIIPGTYFTCLIIQLGEYADE